MFMGNAEASVFGSGGARQNTGRLLGRAVGALRKTGNARAERMITMIIASVQCSSVSGPISGPDGRTAEQLAPSHLVKNTPLLTLTPLNQLASFLKLFGNNIVRQ